MNSSLKCGLLSVMSILCVVCSSIAQGPAPPAGLAYPVNPAKYTKGTAISTNLPTSTGGPITSYSVVPPLPSGLNLERILTARVHDDGGDVNPANSFTRHCHTSDAVIVCRGKTSASNMEKVRPQPPRCPRLEQNTRWPRQVSPSAALGSLPNDRLCRFSAPRQPQCGQGDCLREKAWSSTPARRARNEMANETSALAARTGNGSSSFFARHFLTAGLGGIGFRKKEARR